MSIFALPPVPRYVGRSPGRLYVISGAQNLSGGLNFYRATSSSRIPYPSLRPDWAKLAHSIAPPLQRKPASLGFALVAAFGDLFEWKFIANAVPQLRLGLPSRRYRVR